MSHMAGNLIELGIKLATPDIIHALQLDCYNLQEPDLILIATHLRARHPITKLELHRLSIDLTESLFCRLISQLNLLESLCLQGSFSGITGEDGLIVIMDGCTALTTLKLESVDLKHSFANVTPTLVSLASLTNLSLFGCSLGACAGACLQYIVSQSPMLTSLNLESVNLKDPAAIELAAAMASNHTITKLNVSYNKLCRDGAVAFGIMLTTNTSLTSLSIGNNMLEVGGLKCLGDGIKVNVTLRCLEISDVGITDSALPLIEPFFSLEQLDISENLLDERGAVFMAKMLRNNPTLTNLNISHHKFGRVGLHHILDAIRFNTKLQVLNVRTNMTRDINMRLANALLLQNTTLRRLSVDLWPYTQYTYLNGSINRLFSQKNDHYLKELVRNRKNNVKKNSTFTKLLIFSKYRKHGATFVLTETPLVEARMVEKNGTRISLKRPRNQ